jgi:hypothetical protein
MSYFQSCSKIYVYVDADRVGDLLELYLMDGNAPAAEQLHKSVQNAIQRLRTLVLEIPTAELVFTGCDDVLFSISAETYDKNIIAEIRQTFYRASKVTLSAGVGYDIAKALLSLRKAKLSGRDRIVEALE